MAFIGLVLYCVLLYIQPVDWFPVLEPVPLETCIIAFTLTSGTLRRMTLPGEPAPVTVPIQIPLLGLWVLAVIGSNLEGGYFDLAITNGIDFFRRALVFVMVWLALDSTRKLRYLGVVIVALTALLAYQGIDQARTGVGWAGQPMYWGGRIRWIGLWDGANVLSLLFVMATPFALEMIFGPTGLANRVIGVVGLGVTLTGMALAASRGAGQALAVVFLLYFRKRFGITGVALGAVCIGGLVVAAPARFTHLSTSDDSVDASSSRQRLDMWAQGIEMVKYNPVLGIGKSRFSSYTGSLIAHNTFIQNMGETGLVGLSIWIALVYTSIKSVRAVLAAADFLAPPIVSISRATFLSLVGYLAASFFISTDFEPLYVLMGMCLATLFVARRESGLELPVNYGVTDLVLIGAIELTAVTTIYMVVRLFG
jgi:O-antigen ligase